MNGYNYSLVYVIRGDCCREKWGEKSVSSVKGTRGRIGDGGTSIREKRREKKRKVKKEVKKKYAVERRTIDERKCGDGTNFKEEKGKRDKSRERQRNVERKRA